MGPDHHVEHEGVGQVAGGVGGPIVKDRLWFYAQAMTKHQPEPTSQGCTIPADPAAQRACVRSEQPAYDDQYVWDTDLALQHPPVAGNSSSRNSTNGSASGTTTTRSPERRRPGDAQGVLARHFHQATLSYTATNRLLFEAGMNYQEADDEILPRRRYYGIPVTENGGTFNGLVGADASAICRMS